MKLKPWKIWQGRWENKDSLRLFWEMIGLCLLFMALPYGIINRVMGSLDISAIDPITKIDTEVPFVAWTIVIYLSLYLYYPAAAWFGRNNDTRIREMFAFHQCLFVLTWWICLVFIFLPTEIYIRDQIPLSIRDGEGFWGFWYGEFMHGADKPWNAWPSLHIVQSLLIVLVLRRWGVVKGLSELLVWLAWLSLCVSVMTTKQHFFFDIVTGLITSILAWRYMFKPMLDASSQQDWLEMLPSDNET